MYRVIISGEPALPFDRLRDARIYAQGAAMEGKLAYIVCEKTLIVVYRGADELYPL